MAVHMQREVRKKDLWIEYYVVADVIPVVIVVIVAIIYQVLLFLSH